MPSTTPPRAPGATPFRSLNGQVAAARPKLATERAEPPARPQGEPASADAQAVDEARREIQSLTREIADLANSNLEPAEFLTAMLTRTVSALAAEGGAVWMVGAGGALELKYQINLKQTRLDAPMSQAEHGKLLLHVMAGQGAMLVPPRSGAVGEAALTNPSDALLLLAPFRDDSGPQGVLEIFQRSGARPAAQRGFQRFVERICQHTGDYLRLRQLRRLSSQQTLWEQLEQFSRAVHHSLDVAQVAYTIANEGRRLVGCDRVSLSIRRGRRNRLTAISGQETLDTRSAMVTRLAALIKTVVASGEAVWYTGDTTDLPPQIERALDAYVDVSHSKTIVVLPLERPRAEQADASGRDAERTQYVGALVIEQIQERGLRDDLPMRVDAVARHGAAALANALEHDSLFLLPLWRTLGKLSVVVRLRNLPKLVLAVAAIVGAIAALVLVPADFQLEARGTLQPAHQRDVFAGADGVVIDVAAQHGKQVAAGEMLAELRNTDLEVQMADVVGRREATSKQIHSLERALLSENRLNAEEQNRLTGQLLQLRETKSSLDRQLALYQQKQSQLKINSPIDGLVVTWQARERLERRPVRQGQALLRVADPAGPWELELNMPEDRMGHIVEAAKNSSAPLAVEYMLATHPGVTHVGQIAEMHSTAELHGDDGNTVLVRVAIDKHELPDLRPGAAVSAKVACGRRPIGYVWFHDLIAFVQAKILFRLG